MGCQVEPRNQTSEIGSLQRCGSKKQNITHLFGFRLPAHELQTNDHSNRRHRTRKYSVQSTRYKKEHYLQANCQFVVSAGHDYSLYVSDPDQLVEWELVEEVRLHMSEAPSCPICLYPPVAAKVTRCGHLFCFSCILHYLALTDSSSRKCPICFEEVSKSDLKSAIAILHKDFASSQVIELKLMRRERDSLIPIPVGAYSPSINKAPVTLSSPDVVLANSKLIVASKDEVSKHIVEREMDALKFQLELEGDQPEACFIQEALSLVSQRGTLLNQGKLSISSLSEESPISFMEGGSPPNFELLAESIEKELCMEEKEESSPENVRESVCKVSESSDEFLNISPEDLDIGQLQGSITPANQDVKGAPKATFYFYQESSGAHIYLHALNVSMLTAEFGSLENSPHTITAKVLEKESATMTEDLRQRLRYLRHLPVTCPFEVVEVEIVPPIISELTLAEYQGQLDQREKKRKRRAKEEHRIERRARVEEDKLMGRSRGARINMNSFKHFPSFAPEEPPTPPLVHEEPSAVAINDLANTDFPNLSPPSFAQMTRCGQKKGIDTLFPSLGESLDRKHGSSLVKGANISKSNSDEEEDEPEKVPDYSTAFSHAFAEALDKANIKASTSRETENSKRGKNGKKKKKGILLLSSGGR